MTDQRFLTSVQLSISWRIYSLRERFISLLAERQARRYAALTGLPDLLKVTALALGFNGFLGKPVRGVF